VRAVNGTGATDTGSWLRSGELLYGALLFAAALAALALAAPTGGADPAGWQRIGFFMLLSLFTVSIGYSHPTFGYISFDRVAQVSSILMLGPVDAAWINGLTSFVYPWHRLRKGVPVHAVVNASLTNSGLMTIMVLVGGLLYQELGGPVPLTRLTPAVFGTVLAAMFVMQLVNEFGIAALVRIRGQSVRQSISLFDTLTEITAGLIGVLVAAVWTRGETGVFLLLLGVLLAGMLALRSFAEMRLRLERIVEERTEALRQQTLQLERLATRDTLTGLYNRRHADAFLERELGHAVLLGHPFSVALADVDRFKQINDVHSHGVGDRVLERVAEILTNHMRDSDLVARYGGEEFLLCLVGMNETEAAGLCEELCRAVEQERWNVLAPGLQVTLSIGLATRRHDTTALALLHHADVCLYRAKHLGRNRVVSRRAVESGAA
jgi:diguanylate cyclase (GGDEF)-like protein